VLDIARILLVSRSNDYVSATRLIGVVDHLKDAPGWQPRTFEMSFEWDGRIPALEEWRPHGVLCFDPRADALLRRWGGLVVGVGGSVQKHRVGLDEEAIGRLAAEHFLERGLRAFAHLQPRPGWSSRRVAGFRAALRGHGQLLPTPDTPIITPSQRTTFAAWFANQPQPFGFFAGGDWQASNTINACLSLGLDIPFQMAVLGADDDPILCLLSHIPVSSVRVPQRRLGREGARLLHRLLDGERVAPGIIELPPDGIIARRSTELCAFTDPAVVTAVGFISANAQRQICVAEVVAAVGISRRSLENLFRRHLDHTILEEIQRVRIGRARELLSDLQRTVLDVSLACGFQDVAHFTRLFRRLVGDNPGAFRRRLGAS